MITANPSTAESLPSVGELAPLELASIRRRFFALTLDSFFLGLIDAQMSRLIDDKLIPAWLGAVLSVLVSLIVPFIYFVCPYSTNGQTLGKAILGLRVVSIDGSPLNWRKGILRTLGYTISALPFDLGFLWASWDRDYQAWHDKLAGTCVVRASVPIERIRQGVISASEAHRRQRRWLLGLGFPSLLVLIGGAALPLYVLFAIVQAGEAEMNALGKWPGPEAAPEELIRVDLSRLGLTVGQIRDARVDPEWRSPDWHYSQGRVVDYRSGEKTVVSVWALKYQDSGSANDDFARVSDWASQKCGTYTAGGGVIHCMYRDADDKIFWNGIWIVDIVTSEGSQYPTDVLVDKVRDALAANWKKTARP